LSNIDRNKKVQSRHVLIFIALATILIFDNSFPNALSISSFENKAILYYASQAKLDNTFSDRSNKVVMINFDDGLKSQLIYAKPILDKYGFKASFFIICGRVGTERSSMNWQDIAELRKDGMDIESHSMTLLTSMNYQQKH
jgi:peptidoglycan/xylan/chitin deacetylase (PgdA/CDA1 family)